HTDHIRLFAVHDAVREPNEDVLSARGPGDPGRDLRAGRNLGQGVVDRGAEVAGDRGGSQRVIDLGLGVRLQDYGLHPYFSFIFRMNSSAGMPTVLPASWSATRRLISSTQTSSHSSGV